MLQEINTKTGGALANVLVAHNFCPECAQELVSATDGARVCSQCGLELDQSNLIESIPFGTVQNPTNFLAFGKGLGDTLGLKGTWSILAQSTNELFKCPKCGYACNDLPIRARQTMILQKSHEHPKIRTLLNYGSARTKEFDLDTRQSSRAINFSDYFAKYLRRIGARIVLGKYHLNLSRVADAVLAYCLRDLKGEHTFTEAVQKLHLDTRVLQDVAKLYEESKTEATRK